jgi:midasin (ATPase involved in ribosome maturation)
MQKLAVGLELNQPILLEGGSGIGKSSTVDRMCGYLQREVYLANCAEYDLDILIGSKTIGKDGSVEWRDGIVTQWLRSATDKICVHQRGRGSAESGEVSQSVRSDRGG